MYFFFLNIRLVSDKHNYILLWVPKRLACVTANKWTLTALLLTPGCYNIQSRELSFARDNNNTKLPRADLYIIKVHIKVFFFFFFYFNNNHNNTETPHIILHVNKNRRVVPKLPFCIEYTLNNSLDMFKRILLWNVNTVLSGSLEEVQEENGQNGGAYEQRGWDPW